MISLDTTIFTGEIGDMRTRHEAYAERSGGQVSVVVCTRKKNLPPLDTPRLRARATGSGTIYTYVPDAARIGATIYAEQPFDVITSQDPFLTGWAGLQLRRRTGKPLIVQDHTSIFSSPYFVQERALNRILRWIGVQVIRRADAVRVVNRRERLACIRLGVKPEKVCVVPVATNVQGFGAPLPAETLQQWREALGITPETPVVLWVGRPVAFKNLGMLLSAFQRVAAQMPEARLVIGGDMSGTNFVGQAMARGLAEVVKFTGAVPHPDLPALFQIASIYALSSNYEGLPRVLVEAGAAGLPVVSTDAAGVADVIVDGLTGLIVPINDAPTMAEALLSLLRDPARRKEIAARTQAHIRNHFDEDSLHHRWVEMWLRAAEGKPPCAS